MKKFLVLLLMGVMLLQCACTAMPQTEALEGVLSNEDVVKTAAEEKIIYTINFTISWFSCSHRN